MARASPVYGLVCGANHSVVSWWEFNIQWMAGHPLTYLGEVTKTPTLIISDGYDKLVETGTNVMVESWQKTLDMTGGVV